MEICLLLTVLLWLCLLFTGVLSPELRTTFFVCDLVTCRGGPVQLMQELAT